MTVIEQRGAPSVLYGRKDECEAVNRLVTDAQERRSAALVLRGEAGVGKTALIDHAVTQSGGMTVLRASGVEAELELSFAGVHQLLGPLALQTTGLPAPQARALRAALGLETGQHDRFLVSAALLSLLAELAEHRPLLVTVDDAQWLDRASAEALLFTARRLHAEGIVMLFAAREGERRHFEAPGLAELRLTGLDDGAAGALLDHTVTSAIAPHVRQQLVTRTGGNPLALLELPHLITKDELVGRTPLPDPLPVSRDVERAFLHRVRTLPDATQELLVVAAVEDLGDVDVILRAGAALGYDAQALADAEAAGLVAVDHHGLRFRHPLVRSAVHKSASSLQRRAAHAALAGTFGGAADLDRRAWHRAASMVGRDDAVAAELTQSAQRARERSGYAMAASALERAAELTADTAEAARRLIAAAEAAWSAGQLERVVALLDRAAPLVDDAVAAADIALLRGTCERSSGTMGHAYDILAHGAEQVAAVDAQRAVALLTGAGLAAWARNDHAHLRSVAARITGLGFDAATPGGLGAEMVMAYASILMDHAAGAVTPIIRAAGAAEHNGSPYALAMAAASASFVGDDATSLRLFGRAADAARAHGAVAALVNLLAAYAAVEAWTGRVRSAMAHATEGLDLARQSGHQSYAAVYQADLAWLHALTGDGDACASLADAAMRAGTEQEFTPATSLATWARGLSALATGRPLEAHAQLAQLTMRDSRVSHPTIAVAATGDIVEAAVMAEAPDVAHPAVAALERFAANTGASWASAVASRSHAVLGDGDVDALFQQALQHHEQSTRPFEHGRTLLAHGVWLRRQRRRMDARHQLRGALQVFERLGAAPWATRAQAELRASGETVRGRAPGAVEQLTPQELQIVQIVRTGATNKQIAAQLYLSPRTIDYHLRKVFVKLGLSSRAELITLAAEHAGFHPAR